VGEDFFPGNAACKTGAIFLKRKAEKREEPG